ncbi:MAG TPA: CheR family methyltransferase, partial [Kofleriaceae bacterium]|nr:CheR family methyltransferase [Kofleriaceae bacterium]
LMRSAADAYGAQTVGVVLAGKGTSGALGLKRIKEVGGITMSQAGAIGTDTQMPRAARASGVVDLVLSVADISARLQALAIPDPDDKAGDDGAADSLRDILTLVRIRSGHDFTSYKRATLFRRVSRRMQVCQMPSIADYHGYLRDHPSELPHLLRDFLISVTNFFRDREAFDALEREVIPQIFIGKGQGEQVRVWVAGCATGEEVYSIGMLLVEHAARIGATNGIQLFATDIDEEALVDARAASYPESIIVDVGPERIERFFTRENGYYRVTKELRELVLFSPHNLLRDPPFSRLDLVSCRNLLIYLNREAQDRVLNLFHFALRPDAFLFLGSSESAENTSMFSPLDAKHRLFRRRSAAGSRGLDTLVPSTRWQPPVAIQSVASPPERTSPLGELHFRLVEQYAPPSVLVNSELDILHVSEHAGRFLTVAGGEPTKQLLRLAIPALRLDLRTAIYAVKQPGRTTEARLVRFEEEGHVRNIEIRVVANRLDELSVGTLLVIFDEKPNAAAAAVADDSVAARMEPVFREMEDELDRTRIQLRTTIEQYETSLEELKASNEELQAINEELRSATEELETSKEELQSVNEELTTLNQELNIKVQEISHVNSDLQNLMSATDIGVLFLDRELRIKRFTPRAQELFNVIPTDLGRPLDHLTHHLEITDLVERARSVMQTLRTFEREVTSNTGRRLLMRMLPYRAIDDRIDGVVMTFVDVTDLREAVEARRMVEGALTRAESRLQLALRSTGIVMLAISNDGATCGYANGKPVTSENI